MVSMLGFIVLSAILLVTLLIVGLLVIANIVFGDQVTRNIRLAIVKKHAQLKRSNVVWQCVTKWVGTAVHMIRGSLGESRSAVSEKAKVKPCMKRTSSYSNVFHSLTTSANSNNININKDSNQFQPPRQKRRVVFANQPDGAVVTERFYYDPWVASPTGEEHLPATGSPVFRPLPRVSLANRQKTPPPRRTTKVNRSHLTVPSYDVTSSKVEKENAHVVTSNCQPTATFEQKTALPKHVPANKTESTSAPHSVSTRLFPAADPWAVQFHKPDLQSASVPIFQRHHGSHGRIPLRSSNSTTSARHQTLLTNFAKIVGNDGTSGIPHEVSQVQRQTVPPPSLPSPMVIPPNGRFISVGAQIAADDTHFALHHPLSEEEQVATPESNPFTPLNAAAESSPFWNPSAWASPTY